MSKIPKEIVDKIEQRKALNEEIAEWCREKLLIIIQVASRAEMIVKNGATRHAREKIGTREIIIGKLNARVNIFTWNLQFKLSI